MQTTLNTNASVGSAGSGSGIAGAVDGGAMSDMFTKLLVAQVKNQDPLSPADPSQFVSQLTQLSQVEAMQKMASQSAGTAAALENLKLLALGGQVGSTVMVQVDHVQLGSDVLHGGFQLASAAGQVELVLTGADGAPHKFPLGGKAAGEVGFDLDAQALGLKPGSYSIAVRTDAGETPAIELAGKLQNVRQAPGGGAVVTVAGIGNIDASAITQFNGH